MLAVEEKLDPRVRRTRQMIEQAFSELISEKGFLSLSVQDITEKAGINRATFYAHFPDKYSLLDHIIQQEFQAEIEKRMLNVCTFSMNNLQLLAAAVCEFVDGADRHCPITEQQYQNVIEAQVRQQIHNLISHWLGNLTLSQTPPHSPTRAATAVTWALYGLALEWSRARNRPPVEQYAVEVLPILAANLGMRVEVF